MAYDVTKSNGERLTIVSDRTVDTSSSSISLIGKNYTSYGEIIAENLVHMLENFSSPTAPANPIIGQLWWKSNTESLKVYTGESTGWKPLNPPLIKIKNIDQPYEIVADDHGSYIRVNSSTNDRLITLPNTNTIPVGTSIIIGNAGTKAVSISGTGGAVVEPQDVPNIPVARYSRVTVIKVSQENNIATWETDAKLESETWSVNSNTPLANEGSTVTWTINSNASDGIYYWSIGGSIAGTDFTNSAMSGTFELISGSAAFSKTLRNDVTTEGAETIIFKLSKTPSGAVVASTTVTVTDSSPAPTPPPTTTSAPTTGSDPVLTPAPTTPTTTQPATTSSPVLGP